MGIGFESSHVTAAEAFRSVLKDLVESSPAEGPIQSQRPGKIREQLNYQFSIEGPLNRLGPKLPLDVAAARFVWMMTANNRLADIAFYEPRVESFSDDGLTVPGSSYGMRLRQPQPGLDQVNNVIKTLTNDRNTRRAAIAVYHPIDAGRESKDVPCAFGMFFHCRQDRLHTTIVMRSNNALSLLPLNIFEFSMLAEVVAVEAGLELGEITWFVGSMHLFEADISKANDILATALVPITAMSPMPRERDHHPLAQLTKLGKLEAKMRHDSRAIDHRSIGEWIDRFCGELSPYWAQMGLFLLSNVAKKRGKDALHQVKARLDEPCRALAPIKVTSTPIDLPHEGKAPLFRASGQDNVLEFERPELEQLVAQRAQEYEDQHGPIGARKLLRARQKAFQELAARGESELLTQERFALMLTSVDA